MKDITSISDEVKVIENRNFYDLSEESCIEYINTFHNRINDYSVWKKLDNYDEFFALTTLTDSFFDENINEKKENPKNWYDWVCNQKLDIQYLIVLYLLNDISEVLEFFRFLAEDKKVANIGVIPILLIHRYLNLVTRLREFPIKFDEGFKEDIDNLLNALKSDKVFFSVFYSLLSNIWVFNKYTSYYENIRYAFIDRLLEKYETQCIYVINSAEWDKTKNALYSRLIIFMSLDNKPLELKDSLWHQILDSIESEKFLQLKVGDGTNDSDLLLTIASFLADDDDCFGKVKSALDKGNNKTYGSVNYDVNYREIEKQCYFFTVASFTAQSLFNQNKTESACALYNYLLDSFNEYIAYNVPDGYDSPDSFSAVPNAIGAIWLNMVFFDITEEKIICSLDAIKNLDNKLLAIYTYFDKTRKHRGENAVFPKLKEYVENLIPIAEEWFKNEYASKNILLWRQNIFHAIKEEMKK